MAALTTPGWPADLDSTDKVILAALARGAKRDDSAREAGCSRREVTRRVAALRERTGSATAIQIVVRAVRAGLV